MNISSQINIFFQRSRLIAFFVHLSISLILAIGVFALVYWVWFPHALAAASGGLEGLLIVVGVDVVLGPLLTLIVYDVTKAKKVLARDLTVIGVLQLSGLLAGVAVVHHARPLAVIHTYDTFKVVRQQDFDELGIDWQPLEQFPGSYPKVLYVESEKNMVAFLAKEILDGLNNVKPRHLQPNLYRAMPKTRAKIEQILQQPKDDYTEDGCIPQNIESVYASGSVCFHPDSFIFTDFHKDEAVVYKN